MSRLFSGVGGTIAKTALILGGAGFVGANCIYNVPGGSRGLIFQHFDVPGMGEQGIKTVVKAEGTHFLVPVLQKPIILDVRTTASIINTPTGTKDLQRVDLQLRVLAHPDKKHLSTLYQRLGENYMNAVLPSLGNEVLKAVVARYNADQLLTLRDQVSREIREVLTERCKGFHILLDDVSITHLNFSKDFSRAIEDKQVAEQMAERAKFVVMKAEQEKKALIIRSEGDAAAAQMVSEALAKHGKGLIEIRRIETAMQVADTLGRSRGNVTYLPSKGNLLLGLK